MIDEMTNYIITAPLYQARSEEVGEPLIETVLGSLYARLCDDGSGQCIFVILDELLIQEIRNYHQDSWTLQPQNHYKQSIV